MSNLFAIVAVDGPDAARLRQEHRDAHLAHFHAHAERLALAGPLDGNRSGSLALIEVDTQAEAEAFIKADPFYAANVWERVEIFAFKPSSGRWRVA